MANLKKRWLLVFLAAFCVPELCNAEKRHAVVPPNWQTWTLWQYTDGGVGPEPHGIAGVGRCDRDKFNGDADMLRTFWGYL